MQPKCCCCMGMHCSFSAAHQSTSSLGLISELLMYPELLLLHHRWCGVPWKTLPLWPVPSSHQMLSSLVSFHAALNLSWEVRAGWPGTCVHICAVCLLF